MNNYIYLFVYLYLYVYVGLGSSDEISLNWWCHSIFFFNVHVFMKSKNSIFNTTSGVFTGDPGALDLSP